MIRISSMKDHNSPEAVEARASQEDPIVMYLIVHESLNMGTGKTAAQCAHASQMITLDYFDLKNMSKEIQKELQNPGSTPVSKSFSGKYFQDRPEALKEQYTTIARKLSIMGEWLNSSFRKVVLRASDKEWAKLKEEFKDSMVMVVDAGLTEIPSGSETVIGLWPMRKSQRSKTVQRLQVLK